MTAPFVIAGTQRTGTTLLRTSLSSHPGIDCRGEVFKTGRRPYTLPDGYWAFSRQSLARRVAAIIKPRQSVSQYLGMLYDSDGHEAAGFKLMLNQLSRRGYIWDELARRQASVILMTRRNVLKTLISRLAAQQSGVYHVSPTLPVKSAVRRWSPQPLVIDSRNLIEELAGIAAEFREWQQLVGGAPCFELYYEDYVSDQERFNSSILKFIGARDLPLHSDLKKVNPEALPSLIANYDEIANVVAKSPYAHCLESGR